jgi:diguanylate cyclase (GGDEF)-like protein
VEDRRREDPQRPRDRRRPQRPQGSRRGVRWLVGLVLLVLSAGSCQLLASEQSQSRDELEDRFAARGALAGGFVSAYAGQLLDREHAVGVKTLSGPSPGTAFAAAADAFGFQAALLLDTQGRALAVHPASGVALTGRKLDTGYEHLRAALDGQRAVSVVVPSAVESAPVVAFAVPFDSPTGRRVLSGAFDTRDTPLQSYLQGFSSLAGSQALIVDTAGRLVAANDAGTSGRLADAVPEVAAAVEGSSRGTVGTPTGPQFYSAHSIAGTPWRLLTVVPRETLLRPVSGVSRWLPWAILGVLVLTGLASFLLALRLVDGRRRLQGANRRLGELANVDGLTGVANRRRAAQVLDEALASDSTEGLSVLVVDVDHFKRVNDTFGHLAGDTVLKEVATRLQAVLRERDLLARWGGEEFLVVLPDTELGAARLVAERLRAAVAHEPVPVGEGGDDISVTVSVGVATGHAGGAAGPEAAQVLVHQADRALYAAKQGGRNLVAASGLPR